MNVGKVTLLRVLTHPDSDPDTLFCHQDLPEPELDAASRAAFDTAFDNHPRLPRGAAVAAAVGGDDARRHLPPRHAAHQ